jgi:uncharacterized protein
MCMSVARLVERHPTSFGVWASISAKQAFGIHELVITGPGYGAVRSQLLQQYIPGKILQCSTGSNASFPLLKGKNSGEQINIYWCRQYECLSPFSNVENLMNELEKWNYSTSPSQ